MRKLFLIIGISVILIAGFFNKEVLITNAYNLVYYSPCDTPISYRIGTVDPRFNIGREEFIQSVVEASDIWNNAYGKDLFVFKPKGEVSISLVYDQRQFLNSQIAQLDTELSGKKNRIDPKIEEYEKKVADFNQRISKLNQDIGYWNSQGGAPESEYKKLTEEQLTLQQMAKDLNQMALLLNQSTNQYNTKIKELNQTIDTFNSALKYKPEGGIYTENKNEKEIIIYFNDSRIELIHTLAHEMGHALKVNHINKTSSIMFPRTTEVVTLSNDDLDALEFACRKQSIVEIASDRVRGLMDNMRLTQ